MMTKPFIFDTNTLISAYILTDSKSRRAYNKAFDAGILIYSTATFDEFAETFVRLKFEKYLPLDKRFSAIKEFLAKAASIDVEIVISECRDPKDNKFLELAVSANAACIVTGDKDLLVLHPFRGISILNATDFLNEF